MKLTKLEILTLIFITLYSISWISSALISSTPHYKICYFLFDTIIEHELIRNIAIIYFIYSMFFALGIAMFWALMQEHKEYKKVKQ